LLCKDYGESFLKIFFFWVVKFSQGTIKPGEASFLFCLDASFIGISPEGAFDMVLMFTLPWRKTGCEPGGVK
jgi:hypothetical protein